MLKKVSMVFGIVFVLLGLLGFIPGITSTDDNGMQLLFGIFMVDPLHNVIHLLSGIAGLIGAASDVYAKWFLIIFGVIYALITIIGFMDPTIFGLLRVNTADNWLHLVLALLLLATGLGIKGGDTGMAKNAAM